MRRVDHKLPEMEALEPRLFLSAVTASLDEAQFDSDYGDSFDTATIAELVPGEPSAATGEIEAYRDYDFLKFVAPETGGMQITMQAADGSSVDPVLYAYNSSRRAIAKNNNVARGISDAQITFQVTAGDTYYLLARGYRGSLGEYTLSFVTSVDHQGNALADAQEVELIAEQTVTISSSIDYARDKDYVTFVAPVSGGLTVEMVGGGEVNPYLKAYNESGRGLARNYNISRYCSDAAFTMKVEAGQTYYILAGGSRYSTGDYELSLSLVEDQQGDTRDDAQAVELTAGQTTVINSSIDYARDKDYITFVASVSGGLTVEMTGDGEVNPYLKAYNESGRGLARNYNISRYCSDAAFTMQVQAGQTYYILAGGSRYSTGDYELSLSLVEDQQGDTLADARTIEFTSELTTQLAAELSADQSVTISSSIDYARDRDFIKLVAPVSGGLTVEMTGDGQVDPYIVAYNESGRIVARNYNISRYSTDAAFTMEVQAGQTYYILAGGSRYSTGDYELSLSLVEDEFDNSFSTAELVELDENGSATVISGYDFRYDVDVMRITATHSANVTVDVESTTDDLVLPWMLVYNEQGRLVTYGKSRTGESIDMTFEAQAGESYFLATYNRNPYTTGGYQIDITTDVPAPQPEPEPDPDPMPAPEPEPDDPEPNPGDPTPGTVVTASVVTDGAGQVLQIVGTNGADVITLSQSGSSITLDVAGSTSTYNGAFTSIVVYGFGDNDTIRTTYSLAVGTVIYAGDGNDTIYENGEARTVVYGQGGDDLIISIGGGADRIYGGTGFDSFWYDSSDTLYDASSAETNAQSLHRVVNFYQPWTTYTASADYVSMSINGQDLRDPVASGIYTNFSDRELFVDGPQYDDIKQGGVGDCYYLASLAAIADTDPQIISQMITSLGDGTYAMRYFRNGSEVYLRLDGDLPARTTGSLIYAKTGPDNELWVPLAEKAYAYFRYGQNSYASISGGWMTTVNKEITGKTSIWRSTSSSTEASMASYIRTQLSYGYSLTLGSYSDASRPVVGRHAYMIKSIDDNGYVTVYNPWGYDGMVWDSNTSDGLLRLSMSQIIANYSATVVAQA